MATANFDEPFYITPVYDILLRDLYRLYKASAAQLCRLHYSEHTVKLVKKRLRKLADHGYVQFDARPTAQYRSPYYYVLGNKGVEYIKSIGFSVNSSYRPGKEIGQSYLHLLHHLDVNDVLISACNLQRQVPSYTLEFFMVERELAYEPFKTTRHGELLPDGRQRRTPILIEQDRGTEAEEIIRRKAHAYDAMIASGWYKTRYGVNSITVAFITFEGEKRRDKLRQWVEKEVPKSIGSHFLFTAQPQPPDPKHLWLNSCWWPCVDDKPVSILGEG
jgi:Replication-relaxation